jgi:pimeloyl-ACP methyl ester carboxylesterase
MRLVLVVFVILSFWTFVGCNSSGPPTPETPFFVQGTDKAFEPPTLGGPFSVGTSTFHWVDHSRDEPHTSDPNDNRELPVRIFYPTENIENVTPHPLFDSFRWSFWVSADDILPNHRLRKSNYTDVLWPISIDSNVSLEQEFYPLLIFSHGYGFVPEEHTVLAMEIASQGFIVASINHPFGSGRAQLSSGQTAFAQALPEDNLGIDLALWSDDQIFVINQLEMINNQSDSPFFAKIDLSKIATAGHSYGGAAAFHSAAKDNRIGAAIDVDGTIFNPEGKTLSVPFMFIQSGSGDSFEIFEQVANDGYSVAFNHSILHHSFADYTLFWGWDFPEKSVFGPLDGRVALKGTSDIMVQFMRKYFDGLEAPLLDIPEQNLTFTTVRTFE